MEFLDLGWYSRLLEVSFTQLFHGDCLSCGLPGLQHARKTCCAGAEEVRWLSSRYYTNTVWLGPLMGFLDLGWHILAAGSQFCTIISQCPAVVDCLVFCGRTALTLLYNCTCMFTNLRVLLWCDFVCVGCVYSCPLKG